MQPMRIGNTAWNEALENQLIDIKVDLDEVITPAQPAPPGAPVQKRP